MAFIFDTNIFVKDGFSEVPIFRLKELLKTAGWTVPRSSDGTVYNPAGDQITSYARGPAGGWGNDFAWAVVQAPDGQEWMFARGAGADPNIQDWRISVSVAAGFTGGTPNATTPPTAADEGNLIEIGANYLNACYGLDCRYNICAETSSPHRFWVAPMRHNQNDTWVLAHDRIASTLAFNLDPLPTVYVLSRFGTFYAYAYSRTGADRKFFRMTITVPSGGGVNQFNAKDDLYWVTYNYPDPARGQGVKGFSSLFRFTATNRGLGSVMTKVLPADRMNIGYSLVAPWNGTLPRRDI